MNTKDPLDERARALEAYFDQQDRELIDKMRQKMAAQERETELSAATGITDRMILSDFGKTGADIGALAALGLIPLVEVAWADGRISPGESTAALTAAAGMGVTEGSQAYALLEKWLKTRPSPGAVAAWKEYVKALATTWGRERTREIRRSIIGRAAGVAQSAGGILGLGSKVSAKEQAVLDELDSAFGV
ncbi:MAG: hypothetical protein ACR2FY_19405 [Pirellulaceae bacterium]